ncbi:RlpA-like protein, double-psi beta-barrel domain [Cinara cedri]|uniref:RlpA-like protein, double-psi beta-barrel domain n=1 Tax=Cinara cedri TaxID=506608 RepID=A0A5E4MK88_9HEMI|nr:RlpA-like protein, double-psi beta-barrel domain [Cinara cedri]
MKISLIVVQVGLFVILSISEINCSEEQTTTACLEKYYRCNNDSECCSGNCFQPMGNIRFCFELTNIKLKTKKTIKKTIKKPVNTSEANIIFKDGLGLCSYKKSRNDEINASKNNTLIGTTLNIANSKLPLNTKLTLSRYDRTIEGTVNDQNTKENETVVELSEQAALDLGIKQEGIVYCQVNFLSADDTMYQQVNEHEQHCFMSPYGICFIYLFVIFCLWTSG